MIDTYKNVSEYSTKNNVSLRDAAYILSLKHLEKKYLNKGLTLL